MAKAVDCSNQNLDHIVNHTTDFLALAFWAAQPPDVQLSKRECVDRTGVEFENGMNIMLKVPHPLIQNTEPQSCADMYNGGLCYDTQLDISRALCPHTCRCASPLFA